MTESFNTAESYEQVDGRAAMSDIEFEQWRDYHTTRLRIAEEKEYGDILLDADEDLNQFIPRHQEADFVNATILAYELDSAGNVSDSPQLTALEKVSFYGPELATIDGVDQLVLSFQTKDLPGRNKDMPDNRWYYVQPTPEQLWVLDLFYELDSDDNLGNLRESKNKIAKLLRQPGFINDTRANQYNALVEQLEKAKDYIVNMFADTDRVDSVRVSCRRYYAIHCGEEISIDNHQQFLTLANKGGSAVIKDIDIEDLIIPELSEVLQSDWLKFPISGGVPHLKLNDLSGETTYWVPVDALVGIDWGHQGSDTAV